jgi:type IV pilus assembly protein PilA
MIVVAIIGILAALALPAALDYAARSKVSEAILATSACRTSVSEIYQSKTAAPGANNWGCAETSAGSTYVAGITTSVNGVVSATLRAIGPEVDGKAITLTPLKDAGVPATAADVGTRLFGWICGGTGTTVPANMLPSSCRGA